MQRIKLTAARHIKTIEITQTLMSVSSHPETMTIMLNKIEINPTLEAILANLHIFNYIFTKISNKSLP